MKQISMRIPEKFEVDADKLSRLEHEDKSFVYRQAIKLGIDELKKRKALELVQEGKITFGEGCKISDLGAGEFMDKLVKRGYKSVMTLEDLNAGRKLAEKIL